MIYEDKLISAGFVSYNNEGLSWYKVLNGCILQSVYLYSLFPRAPFLMAEGYGCHPLFIPAPIPQKVVFNEFWEDEIMQCALKGFQHSTYEGTQVLCRNTEERGAEVLDTDIFPIFRKINTESGNALCRYIKRIGEVPPTDIVSAGGLLLGAVLVI